MKKQISYALFLSSIVFLLSSCSTQIESYEFLQHPAMSFDSSLVPTYPSVMTSLSDISSVSGGGGCSTCAH